MDTNSSGQDGAGFRFLFQSDRGVIDRATWWKATLGLVAVAVVINILWVFVRPYTLDALNRAPAVVLGAYLYLVVFGFLTILLLVCEYNLSAKRFAARHLPRALATVLPLSVLFAGAYAWYLPRSDGMVPAWTAWLVLIAMVGVVVWNIVELGIRETR